MIGILFSCAIFSHATRYRYNPNNSTDFGLIGKNPQGRVSLVQGFKSV